MLLMASLTLSLHKLMYYTVFYPYPEGIDAVAYLLGTLFLCGFNAGCLTITAEISSPPTLPLKDCVADASVKSQYYFLVLPHSFPPIYYFILIVLICLLLFSLLSSANFYFSFAKFTLVTCLLT